MSTRHLRALAPIGLLAALLVAATGCNSGSGGSSNPPDQATNGTLSIDEKANGTTVHVRLGDTIEVTLHSTYWSFLPTDGLALQPFAPAQTAPATNCGGPVGSGCGTVTTSYNVGHVGTSTLKAHRDTCGEALRCVGSDANWSVTVVAS